MTKVTIVRVDPYHKVYVLTIPQIVQKFSEVLQQLGDDNDNVATQFFPRLWAKDPGVLLLAAIDPATCLVKGFTAAAVTDNTCTMTQPRLDEPTENDAVREMIEAVEVWASGLGFKQITLIARRADPKWLKKHGFEVTRYVMTKDIGEGDDE
jgi:hypothetical protein